MRSFAWLMVLSWLALAASKSLRSAQVLQARVDAEADAKADASADAQADATTALQTYTPRTGATSCTNIASRKDCIGADGTAASIKGQVAKALGSGAGGDCVWCVSFSKAQWTAANKNGRPGFFDKYSTGSGKCRPCASVQAPLFAYNVYEYCETFELDGDGAADRQAQFRITGKEQDAWKEWHTNWSSRNKDPGICEYMSHKKNKVLEKIKEEEEKKDPDPNPPKDWQMLPFDPCPSDCGQPESQLTREVTCETKVEADCDAAVKPDATKTCEATKECWVTGDWPPCPTECGQGVSTCTRDVTCPTPGACDEELKPGSSRECEATEPCLEAGKLEGPLEAAPKVAEVTLDAPVPDSVVNDSPSDKLEGPLEAAPEVADVTPDAPVPDSVVKGSPAKTKRPRKPTNLVKDCKMCREDAQGETYAKDMCTILNEWKTVDDINCSKYNSATGCQNCCGRLAAVRKGTFQLMADFTGTQIGEKLPTFQVVLSGDDRIECGDQSDANFYGKFCEPEGYECMNANSCDIVAKLKTASKRKSCELKLMGEPATGCSGVCAH